jgi:hypothetical protein
VGDRELEAVVVDELLTDVVDEVARVLEGLMRGPVHPRAQMVAVGEDERVELVCV